LDCLQRRFQTLTCHSAQRNSNESPLLRLPSEIRSKIWEYAVGYHCIRIFDKTYSSRGFSAVELTRRSFPLETGGSFVWPNFALPKVCRQLYVEAAAMVYTLNNFSFFNKLAMDRFIKHRALGQRRLITSITVPSDYFRLYAAGHRKKLRRTFPDVKRIIVEVDRDFNPPRRMYPRTWTPINPHRKSFEHTKEDIVELVNEREGASLEVDWDGGY